MPVPRSHPGEASEIGARTAQIVRSSLYRPAKFAFLRRRLCRKFARRASSTFEFYKTMAEPLIASGGKREMQAQ